jgi:flavodoxin
MKRFLVLALTFFCMEAQMELNAQTQTGAKKILMVFFSWGGNTRGIAGQIHQRAGGDIFEIECVKPYSTNYNTCLEEAQRDQRAQARPPLKTHIANMAQYDVIMLGYPNWWASIPMPIASFLEEYDLSGKTIIPFCSNGGGRFGQSLTAIAKLAPRAKIGDALSVSYSGGKNLSNDISAWLRKNGIAEK